MTDRRPPRVDVDELEKLSRSRIWGAEGVEKVKRALPSMIAELRAARALISAVRTWYPGYVCGESVNEAVGYALAAYDKVVKEMP
jgi:hypothetical protein